MTYFEWTGERLTYLRRRWVNDNARMTDIATELGCTKGVVAGKLSRLGMIKGEPRKISTLRATEQSRQHPKPQPQAPSSPVAPAYARSEPCCFVTGYSGPHRPIYCNEPTLPRKPYCAAHSSGLYKRTARQEFAADLD